MPTETPTPVVEPKLTAAETAPTKAEMVDSSVASTSRLPIGSSAVPSALLRTNAFVRVRMTLLAIAPPPLTATPVPPSETPAAIAAATVTASMVAVSVAVTVTSPPVVVRLATSPM